MAQFDAADLLARVRRITRTPTPAAVFPTDADMYAFITEAAIDAENRISSTHPKAGIGAPTLMATADGGKTYTFGADSDANNIVPLGAVEIFPSLEAIPDWPLCEYDEYLIEGDKIRIPNNQSRTFAAGAPYARFWTPTLKIDGSTAPTLKPVQARTLIVWGAVEKYAIASKNLADLLELAQAQLEKEWQYWTARFSTEWMQSGSVAAWQRQGRQRQGWPREQVFGRIGVGGY